MDGILECLGALAHPFIPSILTHYAGLSQEAHLQSLSRIDMDINEIGADEHGDEEDGQQ